MSEVSTGFYLAGGVRMDAIDNPYTLREEDELPLFASARESTGKSARQYHERISAQANALRMMRRGENLTDVQWKEIFPGSRIAPVIEKLRNAHGFTIEGDGSCRKPHYMPELPTMVAVTPEMQEAYYESEWWEQIRSVRMELDSHICILRCGKEGEVCHHIYYDLFNEKLRHLMTVCNECHDLLHLKSRLKFPSGMKVDHARRLGCDVQFDSWLLPEAC